MTIAEQKRLSYSTSMFIAASMTLVFIVVFELVFDARLSSIVPVTETYWNRTFLETIQTKQTLKRILQAGKDGGGGEYFRANQAKSAKKIQSTTNISTGRLNTSINIVLYEPYHGMLRTDEKKVNMSKCMYKNCNLIVSTITKGAHAVVLQGSRPTRPLPVRENERQIFVFASLETPLYLSQINLKSSVWNDFYNWTMTYRTDSDVPYLYGYIVPYFQEKSRVFTELEAAHFDLRKRQYIEYEEEVFIRPTGLENKDYVAIFRQKNITAAWLVSHCNTASRREGYVKVMQNTIDVDIFGDCNKRYCSRDYNTCDKILIQNTKFYLAFENSLCKDYITEKAFKWFTKDIIVVVRGARRYGRLLPKGTYIDADDFRNASMLALYLKDLGSNESEYIKYLKRKDMYRVIPRNVMTQVAYCNLCRKLNDLKMHRKRFDMEKSWSGNACVRPKIVEF